MNTLLLIALSPAASAATYSVDVCANYDITAMVDADATNGDDYFTDTSDRPARGSRVKITDSSGSTVFDDYTPWDGGSAGCTGSLSLSTSSAPYTVYIYADAEVSGNNVRVYDDNTSPAIWYSSQSYTPTGSGTVDLVTGSHQAWTIASSAGWALKRRDGGIAATFDFHTCACPSSSTASCTDASASGSCLQGATGDLFIASGHDLRKFTVTHELGHALAYVADGYNSPSKSYSAANSTCPGTGGSHHFTEKEFQSAAAVEGFAHYYAAVSWNKTNESDCYYVPNKIVDWDADGSTTGSWDTSGVFTCEGGGPVSPSTTIDARDFYTDYCMAGGSNNNRGTEYDWLRFFWDLDTDESMSFTDILTVWDDSNPRLWTASGGGTGSGYPAYELYLAAYYAGFGTDWTDQWDNGAYR
jgi:hypothetical protein